MWILFKNRRILYRNQPKKKEKCLLMCSYNPHKNTIQDHINAISRQYETYEKSFILGDLNSEVKFYAGVL